MTKQKQEAFKRLEMISLHEDAKRKFYEENKLSKSERGILFELNNDELVLVQKWEKETGNLVYHVIHDFYEFGECYSFLYVNKYPEEWELDREDLQEGFPLAYVKNVSDNSCSEYGTIGIKSLMGVIFRIC